MPDQQDAPGVRVGGEDALEVADLEGCHEAALVVRLHVDGLADDPCRLRRTELGRGEDDVGSPADAREHAAEATRLPLALRRQRAVRVIPGPGHRIAGVGVPEEIQLKRLGRLDGVRGCSWIPGRFRGLRRRLRGGVGARS